MKNVSVALEVPCSVISGLDHQTIVGILTFMIRINLSLS